MRGYEAYSRSHGYASMVGEHSGRGEGAPRGVLERPETQM